MELSQILNSLSNSDSRTEKTASENNYSDRQSSLDSALSRALDGAGDFTKTASARQSRPSDDLSRMAIKLASAEQEAIIKEAELYGAAACDGFMSRMQDYELPMQKSAGYNDSYEEDLLVKQAMELGYNDTMSAMTKVASDAYNAGYEDTYFDKLAAYQDLQEKTAAYEFEKTAALEKVAAIVKIAENSTEHDGYRIGLKVLSNIGRGF
jgi:hypothetical protein